MKEFNRECKTCRHPYGLQVEEVKAGKATCECRYCCSRQVKRITKEQAALAISVQNKLAAHEINND